MFPKIFYPIFKNLKCTPTIIWSFMYKNHICVMYVYTLYNYRYRYIYNQKLTKHIYIYIKEFMQKRV